MNIKIITCILTLENTASDTVVISEKCQEQLDKIQKEIETFVKDKKEANLEWHQSSSTVPELILQAKGIPFTQLTVIIYW